MDKEKIIMVMMLMAAAVFLSGCGYIFTDVSTTSDIGRAVTTFGILDNDTGVGQCVYVAVYMPINLTINLSNTYYIPGGVGTNYYLDYNTTAFNDPYIGNWGFFQSWDSWVAGHSNVATCSVINLSGYSWVLLENCSNTGMRDLGYNYTAIGQIELNGAAGTYPVNYVVGGTNAPGNEAWQSIYCGENITIQAELPACTPNWTCIGYEECISPAAIAACNNAYDINICNESYSGNYSEFTPNACSYPLTDSALIIKNNNTFINILVVMLIVGILGMVAVSTLAAFGVEMNMAIIAAIAAAVVVLAVIILLISFGSITSLA